MPHTGVSGVIQVELLGECKNSFSIKMVSHKKAAEMMHYAEKHVVDYCSACGVAHVVGGET